MMFAVIGFILGAVLAFVICSLKYGGEKHDSSKHGGKLNESSQEDLGSPWIQRTDTAGIPNWHASTSPLNKVRVVKRRWDSL